MVTGALWEDNVWYRVEDKSEDFLALQDLVGGWRTIGASLAIRATERSISRWQIVVPSQRTSHAL
jgi:hypothetical protein